jgi:nicotinate-nucleotide adenylyltransferase
VRIGLLGGTFDPIHLGHLAAARAAMDCAALDRLLIIPTGRPPHRDGAVAGADQRLEMSRLAIDGDPRLDVSDIEIRREGLSYTADTLRQLKKEHPADELFLVLGWDAARLFSSWHRPGEVRRLASVVVVTRPGTPAPDAAGLQAAGLDPKTTVLCVRPTPDISGSALRRAISRGDAVGDRLPEAVARYIAKHRLYMDNP